MTVDGEDALQTAPARRHRRGLRLSVLGMLLVVAVAAVALIGFRSYFVPKADRPILVALYGRTTPVADGVIGAREYGPPITVTWTAKNTLAAFQRHLKDPTRGVTSGDLDTAPIVVDPTTSKAPADLSFDAYAAYTKTSLFLAFRVRDQFVDAQGKPGDRVEYDDGVEVFIDGDHVANDFRDGAGVINGAKVTGSREGFQLLANAAGQKFTASRDFTVADWKSAARRTPDGYVVEIEIPLALIDTRDGPGYAPAGPGSLLHLGLAVTDNDAEASRQMSYAYLRTSKQTLSPFLGREREWNFGIRLAPRFDLSLW